MAVNAERGAGGGLRLVNSAPVCAETSLELQRGLLTPNDLFFLRSNFPYPTSWSGLRLRGAVARQLSLGAAQLSAGRRDLVATLECAGNGRSGLQPPAAGEQWGTGAVSTASWAGLHLAGLLESAGPLPGAVEVAFRGQDGYARSLPIDVARHPDTLLATHMNGHPLTLEHGRPVRLLVPGWYGMASVKWLVEIEVLTRPFAGHFQVDRYVVDGRPLREMKVRAVITQPPDRNTVTGPRVVVRGYAWTGQGRVAKVEVSDDGGAHWLEARLLGDPQPYAWVGWDFDWRPRALGEAVLIARASDTAGRVQPLEPEWNRLGYANNASVRHRLTVA